MARILYLLGSVGTMFANLLLPALPLILGSFEPTASFAPSRNDVITSEVARSLPREELERRVAFAVGGQLTLVGVDHRGFAFRAVLRTHPALTGGACTASQLEVDFEPEPTLVPPGTAPGAIHVSRLPMVATRVMASQVYRRAPVRPPDWRPWHGPDPCAAVGPALSFFAAENAEEAAAALRVLDRVLIDAREEARPYSIECGTGIAEAACVQQLRKLDPEDIASVRAPCTSPDARSRERCTVIGFKPRQLDDHSFATTTLEIVVPAARVGPLIEYVRVYDSLVVW